MSSGHGFRRRESGASGELSGRLLLHELSSASSALDDALFSPAEREGKVGEAREALAAFELLERTSAELLVPHDIRRRIRRAMEALDGEHVELARADLARAGGDLEKWMLHRWRA